MISQSELVTIVRNGVMIKYKLMGFMVYYKPAKNKHLLLSDTFVREKKEETLLA